MAGVVIKRRNLGTEIKLEDNVKRHREQTAIYQPRPEAWNAFRGRAALPTP